MARLLVRPEAEFDLLEAALWYEGERHGLGGQFIEAVRATFERVEGQPLLFPVVADPVRRALVFRFPYGVFFALDADAATVLAVMHLHRNPAEWKARKQP
jgi:plasmid stabilization system protein ParE